MDKLADIQRRYNFSANDIYNLDKTGITSTPNSPKVIGHKGIQQMGQVSSRERGELVTMVGIINACGNHLPPVFVYPR